MNLWIKLSGKPLPEPGCPRHQLVPSMSLMASIQWGSTTVHSIRLLGPSWRSGLRFAVVCNLKTSYFYTLKPNIVPFCFLLKTLDLSYIRFGLDIFLSYLTMIVMQKFLRVNWFISLWLYFIEKMRGTCSAKCHVRTMFYFKELFFLRIEFMYSFGYR